MAGVSAVGSIVGGFMQADQLNAQQAQRTQLAQMQAQQKRDQGIFESQYYEFLATQEQVALSRDLDAAKIESQRTMSASRAIMANQGGGMDPEMLAVVDSQFARQSASLIQDSEARQMVLRTKAGRAMNEANSAANLAMASVPWDSGAGSAIAKGIFGALPGFGSLYKEAKG